MILEPCRLRRAVFSLLMYAFTGTGRSYAWEEVEAWLNRSDLAAFADMRSPRGIGTLEAVKALIS